MNDATIASVSALLFPTLICVEGPQTAASPASGEVTGIVGRVVQTTEPVSQLHEGAEQGGAIVAHQIDQPGLLHESAKLDQMAGSRAPVLHPLAGIVTGARGIEAVTLHGQVPEPSRCCLEFLKQCRRLRVSSRVWRLAERTPVRVRSTS